MNKFKFDIKQLLVNKFIKSMWQLMISYSNDTLEVPLLCMDVFVFRIFLVEIDSQFFMFNNLEYLGQ